MAGVPAQLSPRVRRLAAAAAAKLVKDGVDTRPTIKIRDVCHPKQATLVESLVLGRARNVVAGAGRQSGKSHGAALAALLVAAGVPGINLIYVASTHATCKKMAFLPAVTINRELGLGGHPAYGQELAVAFPNGSAVYFLGADSEKTIERLRGVPNLVMCIIDEASVYAPDALKQMIETVRPGLRPRRGKLVVMGTGSRQGQQGAWYDLKQNPEYEQHRFDYRDNDRVPTHADVEATIDEDLKAQFPELSPAEARATAWFKREYLGEDVIELAEMVYKLTDANLVDALPDGLDTFATGGDIGVSAHDALVCIGWAGDAESVYVVDQEEASGQDSVACAEMVNAHNRARAPMFIAMDPGGLGQKTIRTVQSLYPDVPVVEAEKPPIGIQVRAVNALLQAGRLKMLRGSQLALELAGPTWIDGVVGGKIDEHGKHSDLVPALRYLCVKLTPLLPGAWDIVPPSQRSIRIAAAMAKVRKRTPDDVGDDGEPGEGDIEPASPWD